MNGVAVATNAGQVSIISQDEGGNLCQQNIISVDNRYPYLTVNASKTHIAVTGEEKVIVLNLLTQESFELVPSTCGRCSGLQFHPSDDSLLLVTYNCYEITLWNMKSRRIVLAFQHQGSKAESCWARFGPRTNEVVVIRRDGVIECWQVNEDVVSTMQVLSTPLLLMDIMSVSTDGSKVALGGLISRTGERAVFIIALEPTRVEGSFQSPDHSIKRIQLLNQW